MAETHPEKTHVIPVLNSVGAANSRSCTGCRHFKGEYDASLGEDGGSKPGTGRCFMFGETPTDLTIMSFEEAEAARSMIASGCAKFNAPPSEREPLRNRVPVGFPILPKSWGGEEDNSTPSEKTANMRRVGSCSACENFIPTEYTLEVGFNDSEWTGMCAVRGELLRAGNLTAIASACPDRKQVESRAYVDRYRIRDIPRTAAIEQLKNLMHPKFNINIVREWLKKLGSAPMSVLPEGFSPETYTSHVSPKFKAAGLKGWITLTDPSGTGNTVKLPSFDPEFFDEIERAKIPRTGDDEHPEAYLDHGNKVWDVAVAWMQIDTTPSLWGAPGTGKTELARHLAWIMGVPFERMNITNSTSLDDIQGYTEFRDGRTLFKDGRMVLSWQKPNVILVDEPNVGPKDVWQFFRPIMDDSKQLAIDAKDGVSIPRHPFAFLIIAMNPEWDMRNDGTNALADADVRRMLHIELEHPSPETETQILLAHVAVDGWTDVPEDLIKRVLSVGKSIRDTCVEQGLPISWGLGQQIKVMRLLRWFPAVKAYNLAAGYYLDPALRDVFLTEVRNTFESDVPFN